MTRQDLKHEVYMNVAKEVSRLSHDRDTQIGCVIVSKHNRIVATGFNGFSKGWNDTKECFLTRPEKYHWMIHAERNAIDNAPRDLTGCSAYITGWPCIPCLSSLWNKGVKTIYHKGLVANMMQEGYFNRLEIFKKQYEPQGFKMINIDEEKKDNS